MEVRDGSERWKVEGAPHDNHYVTISYVWELGFMGLDLWVITGMG